MIQIIAAILMFLYCATAWAVDPNWVVDPGTTYSSTLSGLNSVTYGSESDCHDENDTTGYYRYRSYPPIISSETLAHCEFTATFPEKIRVSQIKIYHSEGGLNTWSWSVEYMDDGGWHTLGSGSGGPGFNGTSTVPVSNDYSGLDISNVSAVKYTGEGYGKGFGAYALAGCFELYCYGSANKDNYSFVM